MALDAAVTKTGGERYGAGHGSSAGRNDTGQMIADISTQVIVESNTIVGTWGWDDPDAKTLAQEFGTDTVPAALSLVISFLPTREAFKARIAKAVK